MFAIHSRVKENLLGNTAVTSADSGLDFAAMKSGTLRLLGHWLAVSRSENARVILTDYLEAALVALSTPEHMRSSDAIEAHWVLAQFADDQYKSIVAYLQSPDYQESCQIKQENRAELQHLQLADRQKNDRDALKRLTVSTDQGRL